MKKLFAILLVIVLTSCGSSLEPPKSNTDYENIIGKPIKLRNIEVAQYDFPKSMAWEDAKEACADLGEGWKLPSDDELIYLYQNRFTFGGFADATYWSSTENYFNHGDAWFQNFANGRRHYYRKTYMSYVRAIRAF